ncbi:unnamed protein product [Didymodactylos carnosus]|uniref:Uncharacterized protein n=1 Tax=Didymodactylos carnosus TaxID=1234261 RepID=A0A8S2ING4_9BILA|nr:unnamed protein product [Didymodactylos carnosus]CAF3763289.1 unnamed protein product [Didymodactylos carnosus]
MGRGEPLATLTFAFAGDEPHTSYLDDISVQSTVTATEISDSSCGANGYGQITSSGCKTGSSCYTDRCHVPNFDYLTQTFATVPARHGQLFVAPSRLQLQSITNECEFPL